MRRVTIGASALLALTCPALAAAGSFGELVAVRFAQGACSAAAWSAGLAWVVAAAGGTARSRALALVNTTATGAMVAGPLVGGPLVAAVGLGPAMLAIASAIAVGVVAAVALTPRPPRAPGAAPRSAQAEVALIARARGLLLLALLAIAIDAGAAAVIQVLAPLHLDEVGFDAAAIGVVFTIGAALSLVEGLVLVRLAERVDRPRVMALGLAAITALLVVLALGPSPTAYAALVVAMSLATLPVFAFAYPTCVDGADAQGVGQGAALGALNTLWAVGALVAPVGAGAVADAHGDAPAFALTAVATGLGALLLLGRRRRARVAA